MSSGVWKPLLSLCYTTARPELVEQTIQRWEGKALLKDWLEWIIVTDEKPWQGYYRHPDSHRFRREIINKPPFNSVRGWNQAALISSAPILVTVADDLAPLNFGWDVDILKCLESFDLPRVIHANDLYQNRLTHPIITRAFYEKYGYLWCPLYESMYCDNELEDVATAAGEVIRAPELVLEHLHPAAGKRQSDAVDAVQSGDIRMIRDQRVYNHRASLGFPKVDRSVPRQHSDYTAYMQVNGDDFFLMEICKRLFDEGVRKFWFDVPHCDWLGMTTPVEVQDELNAILDSLREQGCETHHIGRVPNRLKGETRLHMETRLRNSALSSMRQDGHKFILVVDGDELWIHGTLAKVHALAREGVQCVSARSIPVIGLPAFPVETPDYTCPIYVGPNNWFSSCRHTVLPEHVIEGDGFYHFCGTRRTREEIVAKMRGSSHYDDPDYHMENWIRDVLPNIQPGMVNCHPYRDGTGWGKVREWTSEDVYYLPMTIRHFTISGDTILKLRVEQHLEALDRSRQ